MTYYYFGSYMADVWALVAAVALVSAVIVEVFAIWWNGDAS